MTPEEIQAKFAELSNQIDDLTYRLSRKTGLGSADVKTNSPSRLNRIVTAVARFANTDGSTITVDWSKSNVQTVLLGAAGRTVAWKNTRDGQILSFAVTQDANGSRTITTWPSTVIWSGGSAPVLTTTGGRTDLFVFIRIDGHSAEYGYIVQKNFNPPCCVIKGTLVSTPTGEVPIESIQEGDSVKTMRLDGTIGSSKVFKTFLPARKTKLLLVTLDNGTTVTATPNHAFYDPITADFITLDKRQVGDTAFVSDGDNLKRVSIRKIEDVPEPETIDVYDIGVETDNNFFANGIVAHNNACP